MKKLIIFLLVVGILIFAWYKNTHTDYVVPREITPVETPSKYENMMTNNCYNSDGVVVECKG